MSPLMAAKSGPNEGGFDKVGFCPSLPHKMSDDPNPLFE